MTARTRKKAQGLLDKAARQLAGAREATSCTDRVAYALEAHRAAAAAAATFTDARLSRALDLEAQARTLIKRCTYKRKR